jgi:hypothetical protein
MAAVVFSAFATSTASAGQRWMLVYYRQLGNHINGGAHTIENHLFNENGSKAPWVGVTNLSNYNFAIFGTTDINGWNRITASEPNPAYDIRIYDPPVPTDQSPNFYWQSNIAGRYYSFVTWWMYVSDDVAVTAFPTTPVYHYDLVNGLNSANGTEAPGANSDQFSLLDTANYQAQTFVVPPNINRIVGASGFLVRGDTPKFFYQATIHEGGPTGNQVGPAAISREIHTNEFKEHMVSWALQDVPVTPGQTYALKLAPTGTYELNVYSTLNDNYTSGIHYNGSTPYPGRDMCAVVVGVGYNTEDATISRSPSTLTRTTSKGKNLLSDSFEISNSGGGRMNYTIGDNASWLSVSPNSGDVGGAEVDTISVNYAVQNLGVGTHNAIITITSSEATNSPQTVAVSVSIPQPGDFDSDGDVDQADFGVMQRCLSGDGHAQPAAECQLAKFSDDNDVDEADMGTFLQCVSGADVMADPECAG